jgi:hypothetical protein
MDSVAMTLTLPQRRLDRLSKLLAMIPLTQKQRSLGKWHKLLGKLRSMAIALTGARGLFSALQAILRTRQGSPLRVGKGFHDSLDASAASTKTYVTAPGNYRNWCPRHCLLRDPMTRPDEKQAVFGSQTSPSVRAGRPCAPMMRLARSGTPPPHRLAGDRPGQHPGTTCELLQSPGGHHELGPRTRR